MRSITRAFSFATALLLIAGVAHAGKYADTVNLFRMPGRVLRSSIIATHMPCSHRRRGGSRSRRRSGQRPCLCTWSSDRRHDHGPGQRRLPSGRQGLQPDHILPGQACAGRIRVRHIRVRRGRQRSRHHRERFCQRRNERRVRRSERRREGCQSHRCLRKGMAVFTIAKGGLMYAATIAGQKFSYTRAAGNKISPDDT